MTDLEKLEYSSEILRQKIKEILPQPEVRATSITGFSLIRRDESPEGVMKFLYKPMTVTILDGYKHSILGSEKLIYGKNQTMVTGIDILCSSRIDEATPEKPYLGVSLELDYSVIGDL
ncbi:MAG: AraC family transcriptional regulator, partial [Brevinema sp.]